MVKNKNGLKRNLFAVASFAAIALLVTACGGGGGSSKPNITSVKVFGDSLADGGTFGFKFTVQNAASPSSPIYPDLINTRYGVATPLCAYHTVTGALNASGNYPVGVNPAASTCTNLAVAGGRVVLPVSGYSAAYAIPTQMATAAAAWGAYKSTDLVLVDGGGNDAADLVSAYLGAAAAPANYQAFLLGALTPAQLTTIFAGANGAETAASAYMEAVADKMATAIKTNVLGKGAYYVALLNAPAVTNTPRFKMVLQSVAAASGQAAATAVESLAKNWVVAYNAKLAANFAGESRVAIVDFYTDFNNQVANPASYGLTNGTTPVCPVIGTDASGLPTYNFPACTAAALSALQPATPDWWKKSLVSG
jgi:outer membrane lipase/esterase